MPSPPDKLPVKRTPDGRFRCEHLRCTLRVLACKARYNMALQGRKEVQGSPCGNRCNVGRSVGRHGRLPQYWEPLREQVAPKAVASRDKAWGYGTCWQCGDRYKKHSGNHRHFCKKRCAKKFYRPYRPRRLTAEDIETIEKGY